MREGLRLCLDLNIWCANLISIRKGKQNTASQRLVDIVCQGTCELGPVQLVISWGMLNRLRQALVKDLQVDHSAADLYVDAIRGYAQLGPAGAGPQLTLGGTGVLALPDTEDAHVLETALAGQADVLVTANFSDFISNDTQIILPDRHALYTAPAHQVQIVHPYLIMNWLRRGEISVVGPSGPSTNP